MKMGSNKANRDRRRAKKDQRRRQRLERQHVNRARSGPKPLVVTALPELPHLASEDWDRWCESRTSACAIAQGELIELLEHYGWPTILAAAFLYKSMVSFTPGRAVQHNDQPVQPVLEFMQAMALTLPPETALTRPVPQSVIFKAFELAEAVVVGGMIPSRRPGTDTDTDPQREMVLDMLRMHTLCVRGPGYPHQIEALTEAVLERTHRSPDYDPRFIRELLNYLDQEVENRINGFREVVGPTTSIRTWAEAEAHIFQHMPRTPEMENAVRTWRDRGDPGAVAYVILETKLVDTVFSFEPDQLIAKFGEERGRTAISLLDGWSLEAGALVDAVREYIPAQNPVWNQPFIKLSDFCYFLPIPTILNAFRWDLIEAALAAVPQRLESYERARSRVLEDATARELGRLFETSSIYPSAKWTDPRNGKLYESDVIVVFDHWIIIVECKAHAARGPARRGSPDRARKLGQEVFRGASEQSNRLSSHFRSGTVVHLNTDRGPLVLEPHRHRIVERLTVTLDFIGSTAARRDRQAALAQKGSAEDFAVAMPITDLQIMVDALQVPERALHYLHNRPALETRLYFAGDETDLLALYLRTRFSSGYLKQHAGQFRDISSLGRIFDRWYLPNPELAPGPVGRLRDRPFWASLIAQVKRSGGLGWSRTASLLSGVPFELQEQAEKGIEKLRKRVRRATGFPEHNGVCRLDADWEGTEVVAFWVHPDGAGREDVRERMNATVQNVFAKSSSVQVALVIALPATPRDEYPYSLSVTATR